ncbi:helix-turn-helix domain-containing protein [Pseudonocardia endophytica]|uniref:helix-turn-helix domain-containing protein n=1 Tax=Pseudonocardia endophytica TaxID=401976 RepID=UPI003C792F58
MRGLRSKRAQDLLRSSNLTVTEVCLLVGYSSLGSFSSRFRRLVGTSSASSRTPTCPWGTGSAGSRSTTRTTPSSR